MNNLDALDAFELALGRHVFVVRCKDCKYRPISKYDQAYMRPMCQCEEELAEDEGPTCPWFYFDGFSWICSEPPDDDFFCANGEKEDGAK